MEAEPSTAKPRPLKKISPKQWYDRNRCLPTLQVRAQTVIQLICGALDRDWETDEPKVPTNITQWFKQIHSNADTNGFTDSVDLLRSTSPIAFLESVVNGSDDAILYRAQVHPTARSRKHYRRRRRYTPLSPGKSPQNPGIGKSGDVDRQSHQYHWELE